MPRKTSRSANNSGSIRQRTNGRWEARITIGIDPGTGKQLRRSFYGATQKEARQKMTAALNEIDNDVYQSPHKITVGKWLDEWITNFCAGKVKPLTLASYHSIIKNHIKPHLGAIQLQAIRGTHIQKFYNDLLTVSLSPKSIANISAVLHKAFDVAIKHGLLRSNPCDIAELPKGKKHEIKPFTDSEIPLFLSAIKGDYMENAFALCLFAGLREGECLGLSWDCVDFNKRHITIKQQLQREKQKGGQYYIAPFTKSNRPRTIEPPAIAFEYLKAEKRRQNENHLMFCTTWSNPNNLVFTNTLGECFKIATFYTHFKKIASRIGRPDARPHDLRHTAATVAISSGADIKSVQDLLGHSTASFTLNIYAHTSEQMMKDTANRVHNYYDNLVRQQ